MIASFKHALVRQIPSHKQWLRTRLGLAHRAWVRRFRAYDAHALRAQLVKMGIREGDTILLHSAYRPANGFIGTPQALIQALLSLLGDSGTLAMMSMPYTTSTKEYLSSGACFDVRSTPSKMGIVTEVFRRSGAQRSLSATHPILAVGAKSSWLLDGHSDCLYPCGPGSPLERMLQDRGKMVFFDLPFIGFTFFHYIEHRLKDRLPFDLYDPMPIAANFLDHQGKMRQSKVFVFSDAAVKTRRVDLITRYMRRRRTCSWQRIGNTLLDVATRADTLDAAEKLVSESKLPYALD